MVRVHPDPPNTWGHSSAGRAPALQAGGRRFEPAWLHHSDTLMMGMAGGAVGFFRYMVMRIYRALQVAVFLFLLFFTCSLTRWKVQCIDAEERWRSSVGRRATDARDSGLDADQRSQMLWGCRVK